MSHDKDLGEKENENDSHRYNQKETADSSGTHYEEGRLREINIHTVY